MSSAVIVPNFDKEQPNDYSEEFKAELDSRYEEFKNGDKLFSEEEVNKRIRTIINRE